MNILQRLLHDFDRLAFHYGVVTLYALFFQRVLPLISLACIALGLLVAGFGFPDPSGGQHRAVRRVALAGALSVLGIGLYIVVPIWLDSLRLTPSPGHVRFYGMFFLPVGAVAGVLAVLIGSSRRFAAVAGKPRRVPVFFTGYIIGFVVLWLVFVLYSRLMLGLTMIVAFALIRATVTAALGALIFALAPYLIRVADRRPAQRLLPWGYGLLVAGSLALVLAEVVTTVLTLHADVL
jgi:hypothetical protein